MHGVWRRVAEFRRAGQGWAAWKPMGDWGLIHCGQPLTSSAFETATKDMGALSRAILQLKTLETTNNLLAEVNHGSTATVGPERARRVQLFRDFS